MGEPKTAFVFSGGASLGALEVGMLKAIVEEGHTADMVFGTSIGSLNGAIFAFDPTIEGVKMLEKTWRNIKTFDVFRPSVITPIKNIATFNQYLISPKKLKNLIIENIKYSKIEQTKIPLFITATDINTGDEIVFNKGLILEALLASTGIPGLFQPQRMGHRLLVDGGLVNNSPISSAVKLGAEKVVVFPIGYPYTPDQEPRNLQEIIIRTFIYLLNRQLYTDYYIYKENVQLILIPPPENIDVGPHDFSKSDILIDKSYIRTKEWLMKGGYNDLLSEYKHPCDVHSDNLNLLEAVKSEPEQPAKERVKKNISFMWQRLKFRLQRKKKKEKIN